MIDTNVIIKVQCMDIYKLEWKRGVVQVWDAHKPDNWWVIKIVR